MIWEPSLSIYLVLTDQRGKGITLPRKQHESNTAASEEAAIAPSQLSSEYELLKLLLEKLHVF